MDTATRGAYSVQRQHGHVKLYVAKGAAPRRGGDGEMLVMVGAALTPVSAPPSASSATSDTFQYCHGPTGGMLLRRPRCAAAAARCDSRALRVEATRCRFLIASSCIKGREPGRRHVGLTACD